MTPPPDGECLVVNPAQQWPSIENMKDDDEINVAIVERISRLKLADNNNQTGWILSEDAIDKNVDNRNNDSPSDLGSSLSSEPSSASSISKDVLSSSLKDSSSENDSGNNKILDEHHKCRCTCQTKKAHGQAQTVSGISSNCAKNASEQQKNVQSSPINGGKNCQQPKNGGNNHGKWVSPVEFFNANRQRSSALANKVNTTSTFAGSRELLTQDLLRASGGKGDKDKKGIEDITKALHQAHINGKPKEEGENIPRAVIPIKEEIIPRSPIPVPNQLPNNRQTPYQTQKPSHLQQIQLQRCNDYNYPVKVEQPQQHVSNGSPLQYIQQQRQRASANHGNPMKGYGVHQQQAHYNQQQTYNLSCYQQQQEQNQVYGNLQDEFVNGCCYGPDQSQQQQPIPVESCYMSLFQQQQQTQQNGQQQQQTSQLQNNPYSPCLGLANQYSPCSVRSDDSMYYKSSATQQVGSPALMTSNATPNHSPYNAAGMVCSSASGTPTSEMPVSPFTDQHLTTDELNRLLNNNQLAELPEALSDFILKYSRRYSVSSGEPRLLIGQESLDTGKTIDDNSNLIKSTSSRKGSTSSDEGYHGLNSVESPDDQSSVCGSPFSAGSTPGYSPAAPQGGQTPTTPTKKLMAEKKDTTPNSLRKLKPKPITGAARIGKAKQKLREMISNEDFDNAWAWAVRCGQACPGALYYRDPDGDSLLHIVVWHKDLSKVYALTELMMRDETQPCLKPFDLPNKLEETPLFLAVEKRMEEVISYALENGANPNQRARNRDGDAALHYAASRGMTEIVQALCASQLTNLNLLNGAGLTPLLCAVKNHGVIEEESQCLVNNKPTIRTLLKAGADPKIPDAATGKTVLHYSVERMDPDLVQLFRDHLDKESMGTLVNMPTYTGETALHILGRMASPRGSSYSRGEGEEELRRKMFMTLVDCGADITLCESPDPLDAQFTILDPSLSP